jgi:hypothetical protein
VGPDAGIIGRAKNVSPAVHEDKTAAAVAAGEVEVEVDVPANHLWRKPRDPKWKIQTGHPDVELQSAGGHEHVQEREHPDVGADSVREGVNVRTAGY